METLSGWDEAGSHLANRALRDFGSAEGLEIAPDARTFRRVIEWTTVPLPRLMKLALDLIGLPARGPGEKVAWSTVFAFRGEECVLAHQKFGLRLYIHTSQSEEVAERLLDEIVAKLLATRRTTEKLIQDAVPGLIDHGAVIVVNQHYQLEKAYRYFRQRAEDPEYIPDIETIHEMKDGHPTARSFSYGAPQMERNAFHDLVAAITAYLSMLEHDIVLALPFAKFDTGVEDVTTIIGNRWGLKWDRIFGSDSEAADLKEQLTRIVERWRNPYAHGGFEKGHAATLYVLAPNVGAVPVGLSEAADSPLFTLSPASESDVASVFSLFDKIDAWMAERFPEASAWIDHQLDARFDQSFRDAVQDAMDSDSFDDFLKYQSEMTDRAANMDF